MTRNESLLREENLKRVKQFLGSACEVMSQMRIGMDSVDILLGPFEKSASQSTRVKIYIDRVESVERDLEHLVREIEFLKRSSKNSRLNNGTEGEVK